MVVPHYSYVMIKMSGSQGFIMVKAKFQASVECYRGAIQAALASSTLVAQKRLISEADALSKDDHLIPVAETTLSLAMRPVEEIKKANLGLADAHKTTIISSSPTSALVRFL